ncbi:v-type proton ATPase 16 kDa proteolipid subunit 2 [Oleoguttula sp. CCFEE 6159]|nr:v-type proton ATPase 16 kDa proteolipid subunit 2 [Oleoguttula sp. CCFEE 6159]
MKSLIPVVMSGIIAVYALVVAVLITGNMNPPPGEHYTLFSGFLHLGCGLSVGLTGLAAGYAIGVVGDMVGPDHLTTQGTSANRSQGVREVLGLYGLIVALIMNTKTVG